jgi:RHS repeat-associated protein
MVSGAFGGVSGGGGESGLIYNGVSAAIGAFVPGGNQGSNRPAAYLNYILFDENYNLVDMGWQLAPATTFTKQKLSFSTLNIKQPGYLFVYLSYDNDSNNWVYFDDFKITHTPTNVLQYNEYYPFGLQTENSWTREGSNNAFLYNAGSEMNENSGWYETFYRDYDPILGRFNQADPLANASSSLTPYGYGFNDPVFYNDPMGDYPPGTCCYSGGGGSGSGQYFGSGYRRIGPGSGNHWSDQFSSFSYMSAGDFINSALNSQYGGAWSDRQAYYFKSDEEAFAAGVAYNFEHNSWGHTYYGSYEATLVGYMAQKVSGELLSPEAVHTAIDIVRSKHMYDGRPDFLASTAPGTPDPTYSYAGIDGLSAWELYGVILADKTI